MACGMALQNHPGKNSIAFQRIHTNQGAVAVGKFAVPLAAGALNKRGAIMAALIADWPAIAGPSLAAFTSPAKLSLGAPLTHSVGQGERPPAHLLLKVDPARALEVQYMVPQLMERINQALGYRAVGAIRLVQAPVEPNAKPDAGRKGRSIAPKEMLSPFASRLDRALARMEQGIKAQKLDASLLADQ